MGLTRRDFIKAGAATGAGLLLARPSSVFGASGLQGFPTTRASRLFPGSATFVIHSDLHNHTVLSDGATTPQQGFDLMKSVKLDAAALTDHAVVGKELGHACSSGRCTFYVGINEDSWKEMAKVADANHVDGSFVAMRGFGWTTGTIDHVNVWFSEYWTDSMITLAQSHKGIKLLDELPESATMSLFYEWLQSEPSRPVLGGGSDAIAGFNRPNEYGNFEAFRFVPELVERMVSCEVLNWARTFPTPAGRCSSNWTSTAAPSGSAVRCAYSCCDRGAAHHVHGADRHRGRSVGRAAGHRPRPARRPAGAGAVQERGPRHRLCQSVLPRAGLEHRR